MANFDLSDYVPVQERIAEFWKQHADEGAIETELLHADDTHVRVKATVRVGDRIVATGHAEEVRNVGMVNTTSALENGETSAIGRALANYNLLTSRSAQRASREEMEKVERVEWSRKPIAESLAEVDRLAAALGRDAADLTSKWREQRGDGLAHAEIAEVVDPAEFGEFVAQCRRYARTQGVLR